jgi:hypothetical protein
MNSDLTDGGASADPGIDQLFRILTAGPTQAELAGEQSALAMFRANVSPLASPAVGETPAKVNGTPVNGRPANWATVPIPAGSLATEPKRHTRRRFRWPTRLSVRLAAAGVVAIVGGTAAAAYAAALPAPVQDLAHQVLGGVGVPPAHHQHHAGRANRDHGGGPAGRPSTPPGRQTRPGQAANPGKSAQPSASPTVSPSASPSSSAATGRAALSASLSSPDITAGTAPTIDGQLTRAGTGIEGVTVTLIERFAGRRLWHVAGTGQTASGGNVAITGLPLAKNAVFRLRVPGGVHSASVQVTVTPQVIVALKSGPSGLRDLLKVTTQYAHHGNVVWLQAQSASGSWVNLRSKRLNAAGKTWFILSRKRLANKTVRVVLVATAKHGPAASTTATVPPPG